MDIAAAIGAAASAGLNVIGYNRTNFFQNLNLQQSRQFRRQHIVTAQANLFRNDVQQAIGASVTVQERLSVVSTLLLAVSTHSLSFQMPHQSADFLEGLYFLSISTSFLSFMIALHCSVGASILARRSQKELLNFCVRPPFEEMVSAVDGAAETESAEHFERTGLSNVLRLPGYALLRDKFDEDVTELRRRWQVHSRISPAADKLEDGQESSSLDSCLDSLMLRQGRNDRTLQQLQSVWDELAAYTPYFLLWGMRSLLSSFSFFALSQYFKQGKDFGYIVHFFYLILVIGMSAMSERMMRTSRLLAAGEKAMLLIGHAAAFVSTSYARRNGKDWSEIEGLTRWSRFYILATYIAQFGVNVCLHYRFVSNTHGASPLQTLWNTTAREEDSGSDSESDSTVFQQPGAYDNLAGAKADDLATQQLRMRDGIRTVCVFGGATTVLACLVNSASTALVVSRVIDPPFSHFHATEIARKNATVSPGGAAVARSLATQPLVDVALLTSKVRRAVRLPGSKTVGELLAMEGVSRPWPLCGRLAVRDATGAQVAEEVPLGALANLTSGGGGDAATAAGDAVLELHLAAEGSWR